VVGGINNNITRALFNTRAAAVALLIVNKNGVIFHRKGTFGAVLNAAVALNTPHLTDSSNCLTLFRRTATDKDSAFSGNKCNYPLWTDPDTVTAASAAFPINPGSFPARPGQGPEGTGPNTVAKTQAAVSAEGITSAVK
jgi:hypothetical protein